jgi:hypothetical protein
MKIYHCTQFYMSGLTDEPVPHWPRDYELVAEMKQAGLTGQEALESAFRPSKSAMNPGDVVGLDDGTLHRCEVEGWTDIGKMWTARVQNSLTSEVSRAALTMQRIAAVLAAWGAIRCVHTADLRTPCQAYLFGHRRGQGLAFVGKIEGQDLYRRRGAGVLAFVHLLGRLLERFARLEGDRRLPVHGQEQ